MGDRSRLQDKIARESEQIIQYCDPDHCESTYMCLLVALTHSLCSLFCV